VKSPRGTYSLISLDLDHFKLVNDTFGHAAGDSVLSQVASVLSSTLREEDAVYRVGGEEFLIVLPDAVESRAVQVAERIRTVVSSLDLTGQAPGGRMSVSMGVSTVTDGDAPRFAIALKAADTALYASKSAGRDRVTVAPTDLASC
jgi:diguanylate cyclase (GGDEF)-like protein